jgi:phage N-6-adenine-methyltransferase
MGKTYRRNHRKRIRFVALLITSSTDVYGHSRDKKLGNPNHGADLPLPLSWRTQYELTKLTDAQWERGLREGIIHPQMERKDLKALTGDIAHVAYNSGENEWYTPPAIIKLAREVMGGIDLDPASSRKANEVVKASRFYDLQDNGLRQPWAGRVWLNPPYHHPSITQFTKKLTAHVAAGDVWEAIALVNNATETGWFQDMLEAAHGICFPRGRIQFWQPGDEAGAPLQGQAVIYFGSRYTRFNAVFSSIGCTLPGRITNVKT